MKTETKSRKFSELADKVKARPGATERIAEKKRQAVAEADAYEATLRELRKAMDQTQMTIAKIMGVSQPEVSRIEKQADMYLSTVRSYLEAMGAHVDLVATLADGRQVVIELEALQASGAEELEDVHEKARVSAVFFEGPDGKSRPMLARVVKD